MKSQINSYLGSWVMRKAHKELPKDAQERITRISLSIKNSRLYKSQGLLMKHHAQSIRIALSGKARKEKKIAADMISDLLGLELYRIDSSAIVSKYNSETERNLNRVLKEAETSNYILFFDEAVALFGKRSEVKDSHDRYANIDTSWLLEKMEAYEGLVILSTTAEYEPNNTLLPIVTFRIEL